MYQGQLATSLREELKQPLLIAAWLVAWFLVFNQAWVGAAKVWYVNETYHHGFLAFPFAAWSFYRLLPKLQVSAVARPALLGLGYVATVALWFAGDAAQIILFEQVASILIIVLCMIFLYGWSVLAMAWFPIVMLFFAVPFGEEMVPALQELTTALSVLLLKITGLNFWLDGFDIHTSVGIFRVAEACAGVKFLIARVFIGVIASYLFFSSLKKRIAFLAFCLVLPILANTLRVTLTIWIGQWFGMNSVEGFDHLVYGWILFALVFVVIFWVADRYADDVPLSARDGAHAANQPAIKYRSIHSTVFFQLVGLAALMTWLNMSLYMSDLPVIESVEADRVGDAQGEILQWAPKFDGANSAGFVDLSDMLHSDILPDARLYMARFMGNEDNGELVGSTNLWSYPEPWVKDPAYAVDAGFRLQEYRHKNGQIRTVIYGYQLANGFITANALRAKLGQLLGVLQGKGRGGTFIALSVASSAKTLEMKLNGRSIVSIFEKRSGGEG